MAVPPSSDELQRPPWLARLSSTQWVRLDVVITMVLTGAVVGHLYYSPRFDHHVTLADSKWLLLPLFVMAAAPVAFRRKWPLPALALTTSAVVIVTMLGHALPPVPLIALPLYTVTTTYSRRRSLTILVGVVALVGVSILVSVLDGRGEGNSSANVVLLIALWFIADSIRTRRVYLSGLAEQSEERQRRAIESARRSIIEERLEIARELHDVLAHSLSVIAIQSGVGRHVMNEQPDEARKALLAVESTSRSALEELRRVLGVLRHRDSGAADLSPTPTLGDLATLVDGVRATGVHVDLVIDGDASPLPDGLQLSVYRIVQEALTNVVKHARGAATTVRLTISTVDVVVEVTNEPVRTEPGAGPVLADVTTNSAHEGHGIMGMTERALAFDGSLSAGRQSDGRYRVLARLSTRRAS
ncbi:MAG: sensor histidine kinase [Acidimicrobiales bacterium]